MEKMLILTHKGDLPPEIVKDILKKDDVKSESEGKKEEGQDEVDSKMKAKGQDEVDNKQKDNEDSKIRKDARKKAKLIWSQIRKDVQTKIATKNFLKWAKGDLFWINDIGNNPAGKINKERSPILFEAERENLDDKERLFWKTMIKEYLYPLNPSEKEKKETKKLLRDFKIQISLGFVLVNVMWVTAIFMLQAYQDVLGMKWPLGGKLEDILFDQGALENQNQITLKYEYLQLDPIGLVFVVAFTHRP